MNLSLSLFFPCRCIRLDKNACFICLGRCGACQLCFRYTRGQQQQHDCLVDVLVQIHGRGNDGDLDSNRYHHQNIIHSHLYSGRHIGRIDILLHLAHNQSLDHNLLLRDQQREDCLPLHPKPACDNNKGLECANRQLPRPNSNRHSH